MTRFRVLLFLLAAVACSSWALAADPRPGDLALGGSLSFTNTLPDETCKSVPGPVVCGHGTAVEQCDTSYPMEPQIGISFEMWADEHWSYQGGISVAQGWSPSFYSASAWHAPFGNGSGFFGSVGLAAASGTGILADAGAGLEFFPGEVSVQLRADWLYDLDHPNGDGDRNSASLGVAIRRKW